METSPSRSSTSKFRFRDHNNDIEYGESVISDSSSESSSVSSEEDSEIESDELGSMTAKGINHLCLELIELKQASEVDFQENIISNYSSFIRVFKETEGINNEVMQLKYHLMVQKQLVRNLTDHAYLKTISDDPMDTVLEELMPDDQNPSTLFKARAGEVLETLDTLLTEHRLDEAFVILEMEDGNSSKVKFQDDIPPDVWMCYKSDMAERRIMLADKLTLVAENTRVSAAELQKSLVGLSRLGFDHLATRLLLKYYHTRIASGVKNLQSSSTFLKGYYIHDLAKYVFSMISQAARSFVLLHGETSSYDSELTKWACEETEAFAVCFNRHVKSISEISGGLSTVVDSLNFALSYCSVLENRKLMLRSCLIEHVLPCMEGILKNHFDHFKKVISIFTSSDDWVMGRYLVSGMFTEGGPSMVLEQHQGYCLLTNSGRKFVSLLQAVIEDVSSSVSILGNSVLKELMDLFTEYSSILERVLTNETNVVKGSSRVNMAESLPQKVSVIANLSTLEHFFSSVIRNLFKDTDQLTEIDSCMVSIAGICNRLKTQFCKQFIHRIMSNEAHYIRDHIDSNLLQNLMPSLPYQVLFSELRKVEELAEDNVDEFDWLVLLLTELVETIFYRVSINDEIWKTSNEDTTDQRSSRLTQFALDMQFLVEIARRGGYLTITMINTSTDLVSRMESVIVSTGFDLNRYAIDYEEITNSAMEAIKELEEHEERHSDEDNDPIEEQQPDSSSESIDQDENETHSLDLVEGEENESDHEDNGSNEIKNSKLEKQSLSRTEKVNVEDEAWMEPAKAGIEEVSLSTSDELLQLRKIKRVSKMVREQP